MAISTCCDPRVTAAFSDGIVWIDAAENDVAPDYLIEQVLNDPLVLRHVPKDAIAAQKWKVLAITTAQLPQLLVVVDNLIYEAQLQRLQKGYRGCILATSRSPPSIDRLPDRVVQPAALSRAAALELLICESGSALTTDEYDRSCVDKILDTCSGLPYDLCLVARTRRTTPSKHWADVGVASQAISLAFSSLQIHNKEAALRLRQLTAYGQGIKIPVQALELWWGTPQESSRLPGSCLSVCIDRALVLVDGHCVYLHDRAFEFLVSEMSTFLPFRFRCQSESFRINCMIFSEAEEKYQMKCQLIESYLALGRNPAGFEWAKLPIDGVCHSRLLELLIEANEINIAKSAVSSVWWLLRTIDATGGLLPVLAALPRISTEPEFALLFRGVYSYVNALTQRYR
jgi:hypothetical protein